MSKLKEYSDTFETLSKSIVKYLLRDVDTEIVQTKSKKDGGYDIIESSPNLCVNSSFSYVVLSTLLLSSGDLIEWSLVCHSILSYQKFCD